MARIPVGKRILCIRLLPAIMGFRRQSDKGRKGLYRRTELRTNRGTKRHSHPTRTESPYRNRPIEESLELFNKMNSGEIEEGKMVLRAKIDMASPNMHFRDPIIYRVVKTPHHRTGETRKAYPMYDFAHGQSDYFEGVTHSLCTGVRTPPSVVRPVRGLGKRG